MRWRGITEQDVSSCLSSPGFTEPSSGGEEEYLAKGGREVPSCYVSTGSRSYCCNHGSTEAERAKGVNMRIEYDREADALYIHLRQAPVEDNVDIEEGVTVDLDAQKHIVGIEILDASTRLSPEELNQVSVENLIPAPALPSA